MVDSIDDFKNAVEEKDGVELGAPNSGGYEVKYTTDEGREWLINTVDDNSLSLELRITIPTL